MRRTASQVGHVRVRCRAITCGGYTFAGAADEITVLKLVELLDGPVGVDATGPGADVPHLT